MALDQPEHHIVEAGSDFFGVANDQVKSSGGVVVWGG